MQAVCAHLARGSTAYELEATQPPRARAAAAAAAGTGLARPPAFVLCGDLNACSERDYTPGEQYMMYTFSGLHMPQEHNYWAALELLEEQLAIDSFALAQASRPKISCWSCRRVDHILLSTQAALQWRVAHSAVYYTLASDHLPIICWLRREQAQMPEPTACPGR
jgi:endonuclease/exonuclease/phosphatase family metal-dependent hydrolase